MMNRLILVLAALAAAAAASAGEIPLGCGGYVTVPPKLEGADLTKVSVRLLSRDDGAVVFATECSPSGYFFVPAFERGRYTVAVDAAGWALAETARDVEITAGAECDAGTFAVVGFRVAGSVAPSPACAGAVSADAVLAATSVSLRSIDREAEERFSAAVDARTGAFALTLREPGRYVVAAEAPGAAFEPQSVLFDAVPAPDTGVARLPSPLALLVGRAVAGRVAAPAGDPVQGVTFALHPRGDAGAAVAPLAGCGDAEALAAAPAGAVCAAVSGKDGRFVIANVPCGEYDLVPHYRSAEAAYDVAPARVPVSVPSAAAAELAEPFVVVGFSASGRVVDPSGHGIAGVRVAVDGSAESATVTREGGSFRLEKLRTGAHDVSATLSHVHFEQLRAVHLAPTSAVLPDIVASRYDVCGRVSPAPAVVSFRGNGKAENVKTDSSGAFCHPAAPGSYTITAKASAPGSTVTFLPAERRIEVTNAPVFDADFSRELYPIRGTVQTKAKSACGELRVRISPGSPVPVPVSASDCSFEFPPMAPGAYTLDILDSGAWCWERSSVVADAKHGAAQASFVQTGFAMTVRASHAAEITATHTESGKQVSAQVPSDRVCLPEQGRYRIAPKPGSPFEFDAAEYTFDTAAPSQVVLTAKRFRVTGKISGSLPSDGELKVDAEILAADGASIAKTAAEVTPTGNFFSWIEPGQTVIFTPRAPSPAVFYPPKREAKLLPGAELSSLTLEPIAVRPGKFASGTIEPPTAGVRVTLADRHTNEPIATVETDEAGHFTIGPLRDDREYEEAFFAPGLAFERDAKTPSIVHALKLAALTALVRDSKSGAPLSGVLVSVSGTGGYHSNGVTTVDGTLSTAKLVPGDYHARPMLPEYVFKPAHASVHVNEGESPVLEFSGERVAFSARGRVMALDNFPLAGAIVTAVSSSNKKTPLRTDAKVDSDGTYRIRALVPGNEYTLSITAMPDNIPIETSPATRTVVVGHEDAVGLDFLVVPLGPGPIGQLVARVNASPDILATLEASLSGPLGSSEDTVRRAKLGILPIAMFGGLPHGKYELRLTTSLAPQHFTCRASPAVTSFELTATANSVRKNVTFACDKQLFEDPHAIDETKQTSVFSLVALVILLAAAANYKKLLAAALATWRKLRGKEVSRTRLAPEEIARTFLPKNILRQQSKRSSSHK